VTTINLETLAGTPVIIGAGIAGLVTALSLRPRPVILLNKSFFGLGNTVWAQGGIAAALDPNDSPALHAGDTIKAGAGLVNPNIARLIADAAPEAIETLERWGVVFDGKGGKLALGLEAGHSHRRIVHAGGDATGVAIMHALTRQALMTPSITMLAGRATHIHALDGVVAGLTLSQTDQPEFFPTSAIVLATGGIGELWQHTTNPPGATGDGLFLAAKAGAMLTDLEFMQFHPTAMTLGNNKTQLATEALRGEGARLIRRDGSFLMADDLVPRDVASRAIAAALSEGDEVRLDCRPVKDIQNRFPTVYKSCFETGLDLTKTPVPVRPAAHFHMGGVETDASGQTSINGLWACGEVSCTSLHGANRLASNSLLEATVMSRRVANDIAGKYNKTQKSQLAVENTAITPASNHRALMDQAAGVIRNGPDLEAALKKLYPDFKAGNPAATISFLIVLSALERRESRGAHSRSDYPGQLEPAHSRMTMTIAAEKARAFA
jgi:L-aspartate oxidase